MKRLIIVFILAIFLPVNVLASNFYDSNYILTDVTTVDAAELKKEEKIESFENKDIVENVIDESKNFIESLNDKKVQKNIIYSSIILLVIIILIIVIIRVKNRNLDKKFKDL